MITLKWTEWSLLSLKKQRITYEYLSSVWPCDRKKHKLFLTGCPLTGVYTIKKNYFFLRDSMTQDLKTQILELFQQVAECTWTQPCACLFVTELALNNTWMVFCSYFSSKSIYKHNSWEISMNPQKNKANQSTRHASYTNLYIKTFYEKWNMG